MIPTNTEIRFETTTRCNYNCLFCARHKMTREIDTMSFTQYRNILEKILEETDQYETVCFTGMGDCSCDGTILYKIEYAKKRGLKTIMVTNGELIDSEMFKLYEMAGLDSMRVSFHGGTAEGYSRAHGVPRRRFREVYRNIMEMLETRTSMEIRVTYAIMDGVNDKGIPEWKWMFKETDVQEIWTAHNWADCYVYRGIQEERNNACGRITSGCLQILVDGRVSACCFDWDGELGLGDLNTQTLKEIFTSQKYMQLLDNHETGNHGETVCANCDQRNREKASALLYSSNYDDKEERVKLSNTGYSKVGV